MRSHPTLITTGTFAVILAVVLMGSRLSGRTTGEEEANQSQSTDARVETAVAKSAPAEAVDSAEAAREREKALIEVWQKNITQWKEEGSEDPADNSYCLVCHNNYRREKLVKVHEPVGISCETCHGISDKHSEDEDSLVPPDVLFERSKISLFCGQCHQQDELIESDECHKKFFAGKLDAEKTCLSCHGMEHELKVRTRRWNKVTREVEWYDGVRMMQQRGEGDK
jgi:hypothetical protein